MADNQKQVKLRAFLIKSTEISQNSSEVLTQLKNKLPTTKVKDRQMVLSSEDPSGEHDVMSDFSSQDKIFCGTIVRMIPNGTDDHIGTDLLEKEKFSIDEIKSSSANGSAIYKGHTHVCLNDTHIVTDLRHPKTIKDVETYINRLLNTHIFKFNPMVIPKPDIKLIDLKSMTFSDSSNKNCIAMTENKSYWIDKSFIKNIIDRIISDTKKLEEIDVEQLISAELKLKFVKPKGMTEEDYQRKLSAMLKPISDLEDVSFEGKDKRKLNAKDLLLEKVVLIEKTDKGFINEQQLNIEMARFLDEINNAKNNG